MRNDQHEGFVGESPTWDARVAPPFIPPPRARRRRRSAGGHEPPLLTLRQPQLRDQAAIEAISAGLWEGADPVPQAFRRWLADHEGTTHVAELNGTVVAIHRLSAAGNHVGWYEGLRVAPDYQRRGIATSMLNTAVGLARKRGFREIRMTATSPAARRLVEEFGFKLDEQLERWESPARQVPPASYGLEEADANAAIDWLRADASFLAHPGLSPAFGGAKGADSRMLRDLAAAGRIRMSEDGTAMAALLEGAITEPLRVSFIAGAGLSLVGLLEGLAGEAAAGGHPLVRVLLPPNHPAAPDLAAARYRRRDDLLVHVYSLKLH